MYTFPLFLFFGLFGLVFVFYHGPITAWNHALSPFRFRESRRYDKTWSIVFGSILSALASVLFLVSLINRERTDSDLFLGVFYFLVSLSSGVWILLRNEKMAPRAVELNYKLMRFSEATYRGIFLLISAGLLFVGIFMLFQLIASPDLI